jgi:hypothetical protein
LLRTRGGETIEVDFPYDLSSAAFLYEVIDFPVDDTVVEFRYKVVDAEQGLAADEVVKVDVSGVPTKIWFTLEFGLAIVGIPIAVLLLIIQYNRSRRKVLKKKVLDVEKENKALHQTLKVVQKYSMEELDMIQNQIGDFQKKLEMKMQGGMKILEKVTCPTADSSADAFEILGIQASVFDAAAMISLAKVMKSEPQQYSSDEESAIREGKDFYGKCKESKRYAITSPDDRVEMSKVHIDRTSLVTGVATSVCNANMEECASWVYTFIDSKEERSKIGQDGLVDYKVKHNSKHSLYFQTTRDLGIPLFKQREFRTRVIWKKEEDRLMIDVTDNDEEWCGPVNKGAVLASVKGFWLFESLDPVGAIPRTKVTFATKLDLKGNIPAIVINRLAPQFLSQVSTLRLYFDKSAQIDEQTGIKKLLIRSSELESELIIGKGR